MNIDFIPQAQKEQYLRLYNCGEVEFVARCEYLELDGTNYIKTYLGTKYRELQKEELEQLLKYFVWWRIYADLNLEEGEHYKRNFDSLIKAFRNSRENGRITRKVVIV